MNKSILLGRLTKKPEIRYSQTNNIKVANFTLAVNRQYVKQGEERQTDFINIVAYSKLADFTENYLDKGLQICVCGRIQTRVWTDDNSIKHFITEIIAEEINFADSLKKQETNKNIPEDNIDTENTEDSALASDDLPF